MFNEMKNVMDNYVTTENGAGAFKTTGNALVDFNFKISSLRNKSDGEIISLFEPVWEENPELALKYLFYLRDVREGLGERRTFRVILNSLLSKNEVSPMIINMISEYGRWDDIIYIYENTTSVSAHNCIIVIIKNQLIHDIANCMDGRSISLMAKWLPSVNASKNTRKIALRLCNALNLTEKEYRKKLSLLRKHLDVTEVKMSANDWDEIKYEAVPSKANLLYKDAFEKHDAERRQEYLNKLSKGETKINASTVYPYEIVHNYKPNYSHRCSIDITYEEMWKALPNVISNPNNKTIVVADGSGSMLSSISKSTSAEAWDVATSLAIYFAEKCEGEFKNRYITFSSRPQLVDFGDATSLLEKILIAKSHNECSNTNIAAVFELILTTVIRNKVPQSELPNNILIISDMEFDAGSKCYGQSLFESIQQKYSDYGYKMPRLVFWNVCSRSGAIPVIQNELGVNLVSGFSVNTFDMILSGETDAFKCIEKKLLSERYDAIRYIKRYGSSNSLL